jgi:hypothetical protein
MRTVMPFLSASLSVRAVTPRIEDEFKIDIYADKYSGRGTSKANRLRCFIETQDGYLVGKALRRLWEYRTETFVAADVSRALPPAVENRFFELVGRIEAGFAPPVLGSLSSVAETLDFDTVTRDLDRALASAKEDPEDAVTFRCVQQVLDRATFEIERAEEEPAFTKLVYLEGSL